MNVTQKRQLAHEIKEDMSHRFCTDTWWKHPMFSKLFGQDITYTDGVKMIAEKADAYWLIDKVIGDIYDMELYKHGRLIEIRLDVDIENSTGKLSYVDGDYNALNEVEIPFTDFPMEHLKLWMSNSVLLLPCEY